MKYELKPTEIHDTISAVSYLAEASGLSKTVVKDAMKKGSAWVTDRHGTRRLRRAKALLQPGQKVALYYDKKILDTIAPEPQLIHDAKDFSIWNKPAGVTSGGTRYGDHCAIDRIVEKMLDRACFLVHRLDRFAWGLIAIAHSKPSAAKLSSQFQARQVDKRYEAIVIGELNEIMTIETEVDGKPAVSNITPLAGNGRYSKVGVQIETGRKHQIRVHLSSVGYPILGDRQYGGAMQIDGANKQSTLPGLQLAAVELGFPASADNVWHQQTNWSLPIEQRPVLPD